MNDACYCDYEAPSVFHEETRKAIRPHKCDVGPRWWP